MNQHAGLRALLLFVATIQGYAQKDSSLTALLEQYDKDPYAFRSRLRFVSTRRLHQDSIESQT